MATSRCWIDTLPGLAGVAVAQSRPGKIAHPVAPLVVFVAIESFNIDGIEGLQNAVPCEFRPRRIEQNGIVDRAPSFGAVMA